MLIVITVLLTLPSIWAIFHITFYTRVIEEKHSLFRTYLEQGLMLNEAIAHSAPEEYYQVQQIIEAAEEWEEEVALELDKRGLNG